MKRVFSLLVVLALCLSMAIPAFATENPFVPSIGYKDGPEIIEGEQEDKDVTDCLIVTTIKEAEEKSTDITQEDRDLLLEVYEELTEGDMTLPIECDYEIRDLVDVSYKNEDCRQKEDHGNKPEKLKEEGVTVTITFDMGLCPREVIEVYVYIDGQWIAVENVVNNGDGTLTVEFEDICPVAFVKTLCSAAPTGDAARNQLVLFAGLMAISAAAIVVLVCLKAKKK